MLKIYSAPLQGYTEAPFRHFHARIYGGVDCYFTPFVHPEKGVGRPKDMRDVMSPLNDGIQVVPQIIFKDFEEFSMLVKEVSAKGHRHIDLNMGCPFPPQVKKGRGAGFIGNKTELRKIADYVLKSEDISFSVKMRLGVNESSESDEALRILSDVPLEHLCVHPRVAAQQYTGNLFMDDFARIAENTKQKLVFNGDLTTADSIAKIVNSFPGLHAVMIGRGLLARPSLAIEYTSSREWTRPERIKALMEFHRNFAEYWESRLYGQTQILQKLKPFWQYLEDEIGHKVFKAINKAKTLMAYSEAVAAISRS